MPQSAPRGIYALVQVHIYMVWEIHRTSLKENFPLVGSEHCVISRNITTFKEGSKTIVENCSTNREISSEYLL